MAPRLRSGLLLPLTTTSSAYLLSRGPLNFSGIAPSSVPGIGLLLPSTTTSSAFLLSRRPPKFSGIEPSSILVCYFLLPPPVPSTSSREGRRTSVMAYLDVFPLLLVFTFLRAIPPPIPLVSFRGGRRIVVLHFRELRVFYFCSSIYHRRTVVLSFRARFSIPSAYYHRFRLPPLREARRIVVLPYFP